MKIFDYFPKTKKQKTNKIKETINSFDQFLKNIYPQNLSPEQAKKNLEKGVVELLYPNGKHALNGLLITEDGYFITNRHWSNSQVLPNFIKTYSGDIYTLENWRFQPKDITSGEKELYHFDLAMLKANIKNSPIPKNYSFKKLNEL